MKGHDQMSPQEESTATPEELLSWAVNLYEDTKTWPSKRFRLQTSGAGGNSRLLIRSAAYKAQIRYGGEVVEVIPMRSAFTGRAKGPS